MQSYNYPIKRISSYTNMFQNFKEKQFFEPITDDNKISAIDKSLVKITYPELGKMLESCLCSICFNVPFDPVECLRCSAIFCPYCYEQCKKNYNTCPACKQQGFGTKTAFHVKNSLNIFKIKCYNKGCNELINYSTYKNHLLYCPYKMYKCKYENCKFVAVLEVITNHILQCDYQKLKCKECGKIFIKKNYELHKNDVECLKIQNKKLRDELEKLKVTTKKENQDLMKKYRNEEKKRKDLEIQIQEFQREREETANVLKGVFNKLSKKNKDPIYKKNEFNTSNRDYSRNTFNGDYDETYNKIFYNTETSFYK